MDATTVKPIRVSVISSPRSGNTWLRRVLASAFNLVEAAYHTPEEIPWSELPPACALQIHWLYDSEFEQKLRSEGFSILVLCRHPFDILLSILQFARHEPQTARWLDGLDGDESSILGCSPCDQAFLEYCLSQRAQGLLSVSYQWWQMRNICRVRYEDLVAQPERVLKGISNFLDCAISLDKTKAALASNSFSALQATSVNNHFWKGQQASGKS